MPRKILLYLTDRRLAYLGPHPAQRIYTLIDQAIDAEDPPDDHVDEPNDPPADDHTDD